MWRHLNKVWRYFGVLWIVERFGLFPLAAPRRSKNASRSASLWYLLSEKVCKNQRLDRSRMRKNGEHPVEVYSLHRPTDAATVCVVLVSRNKIRQFVRDAPSLLDPPPPSCPTPRCVFFSSFYPRVKRAFVQQCRPGGLSACCMILEGSTRSTAVDISPVNTIPGYELHEEALSPLGVWGDNNIYS